MLYRILFVHLKFQCGSDTLFYMVAIQLPPRYTIAKLTFSERLTELIKNLCDAVIRLSGFLHGINQPHKFFRSMRKCNIVMLSFGAFLGKVLFQQ